MSNARHGRLKGQAMALLAAISDEWSELRQTIREEARDSRSGADLARRVERLERDVDHLARLVAGLDVGALRSEVDHLARLVAGLDVGALRSEVYGLREQWLAWLRSE